MLKTKILQKILSSFLLVVMAVGEFSTPIAAMITEIGTQGKNQKESSNQEASIVIDNQFLAFYSVGETKKISATLNGAEGKLIYSASNAESVKVDQSRNSNMAIWNRSCYYYGVFSK